MEADGPIVTPFTRLLGIRHPIVSAPMGRTALPELAAAVTNAGGLGGLVFSWDTHSASKSYLARCSGLPMTVPSSPTSFLNGISTRGWKPHSRRALESSLSSGVTSRPVSIVQKPRVLWSSTPSEHRRRRGERLIRQVAKTTKSSLRV